MAQAPIKELPPGLQNLLWDVDLEKFDTDRHAGYLVQRVLERGTLAEWRKIRSFYGDTRIEAEVDRLPSLEPKALTYCAALFKRPPESFSCYTKKPSQPAPWIS